MKSLKTIALLLTVLTFLYDSANGQCKYSTSDGKFLCVCTTNTIQSEVDRCDKEIRSSNFSKMKLGFAPPKITDEYDKFMELPGVR
jgi:hypothetical protein